MLEKNTILEDGNPPHRDAGIFGCTATAQESTLILIPVPWEATTSYGRGTAQAPEAVLKASHQLDLYDPVFGEPYRRGIHLLSVEPQFKNLNSKASQAALNVISSFETGIAPSDLDLSIVNNISKDVHQKVAQISTHWLQQNKICAVLGGDHSSPFGLIQSLALHRGERNDASSTFDILHIDAHHDLRQAYEGFEDSHASIMYNVLEKVPQINKLIQVGIRDFSKHEKLYAQQNPKIITHYDDDVFRRKAEGTSFAHIARQIIEPLGHQVYISFDIDGLDPSLCPHTGTPVPGGLSFQEAMYILEILVKSGRKIIGFDLCEVSPGPSDWDANVGARVLYKLCGAALFDQV